MLKVLILFFYSVFIQSQITGTFFKNNKELIEIKKSDSIITIKDSISTNISFLSSPVDNAYISSYFTKKRFHPVLKIWKEHKGTDFTAPFGSPIKATSSGVIEEIGYNESNGNYVKIKHNLIYTTQYLHMSKILVDVGQNVSLGEKIGLVGSSGLSTGSHVCYRFWKNGIQINPFTEFNKNFNISENIENETSQEEEHEFQETNKKEKFFKKEE